MPRATVAASVFAGLLGSPTLAAAAAPWPGGGAPSLTWEFNLCPTSQPFMSGSMPSHTAYPQQQHQEQQQWSNAQWANDAVVQRLENENHHMQETMVRHTQEMDKNSMKMQNLEAEIHKQKQEIARLNSELDVLDKDRETCFMALKKCKENVEAAARDIRGATNTIVEQQDKNKQNEKTADEKRRGDANKNENGD